MAKSMPLFVPPKPTRTGKCLGWCNKPQIRGWYCPACKRRKDALRETPYDAAFRPPLRGKAHLDGE